MYQFYVLTLNPYVYIVHFFLDMFGAVLGTKGVSWDNEVSFEHPPAHLLWASFSLCTSHQALTDHTRVATYLPSGGGLSPFLPPPPWRQDNLDVYLIPCFALKCCGENIIWLLTARCGRKGEDWQIPERGILELEMQDPSLWKPGEILWPLPQPVGVGFREEEESPVRMPNVLSCRNMSEFKIALRYMGLSQAYVGCLGTQPSWTTWFLWENAF